MTGKNQIFASLLLVCLSKCIDIKTNYAYLNKKNIFW